jgi:uncharacterized protein YjhX (UPF0386 family)
MWDQLPLRWEARRAFVQHGDSARGRATYSLDLTLDSTQRWQKKTNINAHSGATYSISRQGIATLIFKLRSHAMYDYS